MSKVVPARRGNSDLDIANILPSNDRLHEPELVESATLSTMPDLTRTEYYSPRRKLPRRQRLDVREILAQTETADIRRDRFEAGDVVEECAEEYCQVVN